MRIAYPVATEDCVNKARIKGFTEPYAKVFPMLKSLGYEGVELLVRDPEKVDVQSLSGLLSANSLGVAAIGTIPMQADDKLFLIHPDKNNREEARKRCSGLLRLCRYFYAPLSIGKYRGMISDSEGCSMENMKAVIKDICEEAKSMGVTVMIEPQNTSNINNINTLTECTEFIRELDCWNVKIHADIYHMYYTEEDPLESIRKYGEDFGFIHIADSERKNLGTGTIPLHDVMNALKEVGYSGFLSPEIEQTPDAYTAAKNSAEYMAHGLHSV